MKTKTKYVAESPSFPDLFTFEANDNNDAWHWVVNHLDTSREWVICRQADYHSGVIHPRNTIASNRLFDQ